MKDPMVLVYIPSRAGVTSFYRDNNNLWNKYVPYMQLYQADWIDASCKGEEVEGTNNYKHQLDWFTSVDDKLERKAANQIFKIEYVRSDDPTQTKRVLPGYGETDNYWKGKEIKDESGQVTGTEDVPFTEQWTREDYTYTVTYYVTCIIPGLEGLQVQISRPLDVPGKKQQLHLSVSAYSTPHDSQSVWDTGGYNTIKHTLTITRDRSMKTGYFQVKRQQTQGGEWVNEGESFQVLDEGNTFTGTFTREVTFNQPYNNHTKYDNYKVVYTPGEGEQVATSAQTSNEDKADFLTADFSVQVHGNEVLGVNNYLYSDQVKFTNITDEKGLVNNYSTRNGSSDRWNATYSRYENFTNPQENPIFVSTYPETRSGNQTYKYLGYLHTTNNGVWGVGPATTTHNPDITVSGEVTVDIYPHNQVIEVEMNPDSESETQTNPIWNYTGAKTKTKQIFPGVDFDIRADKLPRDIDGKTSYNVAFGLVLYVWEQVEEEVQGVETLVWKWNKHIVNGQQYFNQIDNVGTPDSKGVYKPTFTPSGTIAMTGDSYTTQQNVIYDFKNKVCHYDAFAFYVNPTTGYVVAYAHSGFPKITSTVTYDSQEYREALDRVPYEEVEFENGVGEVEGTTYIKLDDGAIRADKFYQGNTTERYDGYAYIVLDLDKVIPTKDSHYKVGDSRSDDLRSAITSYKITATQKDNTPDASTGRKGLQLFYPTIGDEAKTTFNIANYDDGKKPAIDGLKPGLHWNTATADELHIYADVTVDQESGAITNVNLVEGVHPTGDSETTNRLESAKNNCVLIGLRYIDKMREDGYIGRQPDPEVDPEGGPSSAPRKKGWGDNPQLKNGITLLIEPEYTFVQPEKPVFSFGGNYHSGVTPQYATDVPEVATIDEDGDDTT
ncbi:MAG: hypothetical protein HUJ99_05890, partial [Bacteroidaceae bacterium]|nr:hypothetical protein [Bacteroidaceae bacterium]